MTDTLDYESDLFFAQLKRHEGAIKDKTGLHRAYRCPAGKLTIGYGHNLEANPIPGLGAESRITEERALEILKADVDKFATQLKKALPWVDELEDFPRYCVLLNMAFNIGVKSLSTFTTTLGLIKSGEYSRAASAMLKSKWATQVGKRARELALQMETGEWTIK